MDDQRKIAIVGGGVSGLVAAYLLGGRHSVTLFEEKEHAGGHAHTVDVPVPEGGAVSADIGFMVFNRRNYPRFESLLGELGVNTRTSDMSFSVSDGMDFEFSGDSFRGLFANRRHLVDPAFLRMAAEYVRFNREARALLASDADPSLRGWLEECRFSRRFIEGLMVPQASAVWSADPEQMWEFPARFLVRFFDNHGMLRFTRRPAWRTVVGGSRTYVDAIASRLGGRLRVGHRVRSVRRTPHWVEVAVGGMEPEQFDEVILACHADQALALLDDPTPSETAVLSAIRYRDSRLALHSDAKMLPRRIAARASWNSHLVESAVPGPTVTYDLRRLQGLQTSLPVLATLNLTDRIDPDKVHSTYAVSHPVYTPEALAAQRRHTEVSGADRVHFAGSYWGWGFHEDGVVSAHRVVESLVPSSCGEAVAA